MKWRATQAASNRDPDRDLERKNQKENQKARGRNMQQRTPEFRASQRGQTGRDPEVQGNSCRHWTQGEEGGM